MANMLTVMSLVSCAFCGVIVLLAGGALFQDFEDLSGSFEFIFHDRQNLLLTIYKNSVCYHIHMRNDHDLNINDCPRTVENQVMIQVRYGEEISDSSLQDMRENFHDLVADYHCLNKTVKRLEIKDCLECSDPYGC